MHSHIYQPDVVVVPGRSLSPDVQSQLQSLVIEAISIPIHHATRELSLLDPRLVIVSDEVELTAIRQSLREGYGERPLAVVADWSEVLSGAAVSSGLVDYVFSRSLSSRELARELVRLLEALRDPSHSAFRPRRAVKSSLPSHPPSSGVRTRGRPRSTLVPSSETRARRDSAEIARIRLKKAREN